MYYVYTVGSVFQVTDNNAFFSMNNYNPQNVKYNFTMGRPRREGRVSLRSVRNESSMMIQ